jgi:TRAP-type C4-dicarboxylate transport system permease small subunit
VNYLRILLETQQGEVVIDDTWYSPGVVGFIATFGMAGAAVFIIFDMVRRIRKVRYRAEIAEKLDAEQEATSEAKPKAKPIKPSRPKPPEKPKR